MKRFILVAFIVLFSIGLCACKGGGENPVATKEPLKTVMPTQSNASKGAVESEQPAFSEGEAFSMAEDLLKTMTLEEKIGQMFMIHLSQLDDSRTKDGNIYYLSKKLKKQLHDYNIGGVYLTRNNIGTIEQTKKLVSELQKSVSGSTLYISAEEEGGGEHSISASVPELDGTGYMTQSEMGQHMTGGQAQQTGKTIAGELTKLGINLNLAPVADIADESNPEYAKRCLGDDKDKVSDMLANMVQGMREGGLGVTLKYFPGIGNVPGEYTEEILENKDSLMTLRNNNFETYAAGIEAGADCVMVSSVSVNKVTVKTVPAFMSGDIVTSLLREELDFDGVIMTCPLNDNLIVKKYTAGFVTTEAVKAGCDMILLPKNFKESYQALLGAVKSGAINEKVINTSVRRILQNKIQRGILVLEQ